MSSAFVVATTTYRAVNVKAAICFLMCFDQNDQVKQIKTQIGLGGVRPNVVATRLTKLPFVKSLQTQKWINF